MPHGLQLAETFYRRMHFFHGDASSEGIDIQKIQARPTQCVFERHHYYPSDYFFFKFKNNLFFGRKMISDRFLSGTQKVKKCDLILAPMIIGFVKREQITQKGLIVFYKPLEPAEKQFLFHAFETDPKMDLYFPFPVLANGFKEFVQSNEVWDVNDALATDLNTGEEHLREATCEYLKKFDMKDRVVYDPACSTGAFLNFIKAKFPEAYAVGQDLNSSMVDYARRHSKIDKLHVGNSINPCISKNSADFIFFRFLNASVVSTEDALKLFCRIAECCKDGGEIIVFGFTPVLLSAEIFEMLNLQVKQCIAVSKKNNAIFQYYVLRKNGPIPSIRYEQFSPFNFSLNPSFVKLLGDTLQKSESDLGNAGLRSAL